MILSFSLSTLPLAGALVSAGTPLAQASFGQGVLMWLQGIACVLVSVAAVVFIIRSLRGQGSGKGGSCCSAADLPASDAAPATTAAQAVAAPEVAAGTVAGAAAAAVTATGAATDAAAGMAAAAAACTDEMPAAEAAGEAVNKTMSQEEEERRLMAVVAAAVHTLMAGKAHRIVRISPTSPRWALEGRRDIFASRKVR